MTDIKISEPDKILNMKENKIAETVVKEEEVEEHAKAPDASTSDAAAETSGSAPTTAQPDPDQEPVPCPDIEKFLRRSAAAGDIHVSLESIPYHLCETTKEVLRSAAHLHLVCKKKFAPKVPSLSQFLRMYGPSGSEICQETLAVALAKQFDATLLIFDPLPQPVDSSLAAGATADTQADTTDTRGILPIISRLVKVVSEECKHGPLVVFLSDIFVNDIKKSISGSKTMFSMLKDHLDKIPAGVLVIGSRVKEEEISHSSQSKHEYKKETIKKHPEKLSDLFPNQVTIRIPQDEDQVVRWKRQLDQDTETLRARRNNARIRSTLELIGWSCSDLETNCIKEKMLSDESVSRVVGYAVMHHLESKKPDDPEDVLSSDSIKHGFNLLEAIKSADKSPKKSLKDVVVTANMFEKKLLDDVIPPDELGVSSFEDVGGLEDVKDALRESVILPLQRPELCSKGQLRKPCKGGILLFGPPGTGKTLLARAVAAEAGANFINLSMSRSKWYGDVEKYAKAAFTLASKIAPSVVFVDEIDIMSSSRGSGDSHRSSHPLKNEFMMNWDGLDTKDRRQVLILAATNRPFDIDEAVLRRFSRRLMVSLPDSSNREKILRVVLSKEELAPDVDLVAVANLTDGYSGSDLKELCVVAAHCAIKEILEKERSSTSSGSGVGVRAFQMDDFRYAREHVGASTSSGSADARKLGDWSDRYGEGGSRKKQVPSYFL